MNIRQWLALGATFTAICTLPSYGLAETNVSGRLSTVLDWSDNSDRFNTGSDSSEMTASEYILVNIKDLGGDGYNFKTYGRFAWDFENDNEADSEVYYAYLEKNDFLTDLDLRLGRQFIATIAGASIVDGVLLKYQGLGPSEISVFGGGDVHLDDEYDFRKDLFYGAELSFRAPDHYAFDLSYVQKNEAVSASLDGTGNDEVSIVASRLAGLEAYYNIKNTINFYGDVQYNVTLRDISYYLLGLKYYKTMSWSLRTEYLYSQPLFSDTSIYSVFAADEYREASGQLDYKITSGLNSFLRYTRELYRDFDDADVVELGLEKIKTSKISGYLSGIYRKAGDGQDLSGFKARGVWAFTNSFQAGAGIHYDVYERQADENDLEAETTSSRIWLDATGALTRKINLQAKIEKIKSDAWDEYYRGRVRLNVRF